MGMAWLETEKLIQHPLISGQLVNSFAVNRFDLETGNSPVCICIYIYIYQCGPIFSWQLKGCDRKNQQEPQVLPCFTPKYNSSLRGSSQEKQLVAVVNMVFISPPFLGYTIYIMYIIGLSPPLIKIITATGYILGAGAPRDHDRSQHPIFITKNISIFTNQLLSKTILYIYTYDNPWSKKSMI